MGAGVDVKARHLDSHADGYQCELAATGEGWVMIAAGLPAVDERFVGSMDAADREWESYKALPRAGVSAAEWMESYAAAREHAWLIESDGQQVRVVHEADVEAVSGIAVSGGDRLGRTADGRGGGGRGAGHHQGADRLARAGRDRVALA